jgi:hypothetical protein
MKKGDSPVMIVYPPDELSDESIYAMSEFLHEICRAFEQHYYRRITQHINMLERDARDRVYTGHLGETRDEAEPF